MNAITVQHLKKNFSVPQKEPGLVGTLRSIVSPKQTIVSAVRDISFKINEGELVGFIGPNGAGKTTTLKMLSGILYPTSGSVSVFGHTPWKREGVFLKNITLVMGQKNQLWWELPAVDSFLLNRAIYDIPRVDFKKTLAELTALLEVEKIIYTPVRKLSLGQRMRMELVAALLHRPKVLFLDEPTIGLDLVAQERIRDFISVYNKKYGATVILTSHYMGDIERLATRIIIINDGKIIFDGKLSKILDRFNREKVISVVFETAPKIREFARLGDVVSYDFPRAEIRVSRGATPLAVSEILQKFSVVDLTITEPPIEEVIRGIFETGKA